MRNHPFVLFPGSENCRNFAVGKRNKKDFINDCIPDLDTVGREA